MKPNCDLVRLLNHDNIQNQEVLVSWFVYFTRVRLGFTHHKIEIPTEVHLLQVVIVEIMKDISKGSLWA